MFIRVGNYYVELDLFGEDEVLVLRVFVYFEYVVILSVNFGLLYFVWSVILLNK